MPFLQFVKRHLKKVRTSSALIKEIHAAMIMALRQRSSKAVRRRD
jgi:hypothetical protein